MGNKQSSTLAQDIHLAAAAIVGIISNGIPGPEVCSFDSAFNSDRSRGHAGLSHGKIKRVRCPTFKCVAAGDHKLYRLLDGVFSGHICNTSNEPDKGSGGRKIYLYGVRAVVFDFHTNGPRSALASDERGRWRSRDGEDLKTGSPFDKPIMTRIGIGVLQC